MLENWTQSYHTCPATSATSGNPRKSAIHQSTKLPASKLQQFVKSLLGAYVMGTINLDVECSCCPMIVTPALPSCQLKSIWKSLQTANARKSQIARMQLLVLNFQKHRWTELKIASGQSIKHFKAQERHCLGCPKCIQKMQVALAAPRCHKRIDCGSVVVCSEPPAE